MSAAARSATPHDFDPSAFDLGAGRDAALCLHGLTGTPREVRPLGAALAVRGLRAVGIVLPGHGGTPASLADLRWQAWLAGAEAAYARLRAEHERVVVVGMSLGGLLALALATRAARPPEALCVVGVPLRLRSKLRFALPVLKRIVPMFEKRRGSDIRDPVSRASHPSMPQMPAASIYELARLQREVGGRLAQVRNPVLVAHGALDRTAHPDDALAIVRAVSSPVRSLQRLPNSGHLVPVDYDGPELARALVRFVARSEPALRYVADAPEHR